MNQYCTYLTNYSGNKLPPFYIGSSNINRINSGYHGSIRSKKYKTIWNQELKLNPHLFKTRIISYHISRKEATEKECYFQEKLNVVKNVMYINQAIASINGFFGRNVSGNNNPNYGNKWSLQKRNEISERKKQFYKNNPEYGINSSIRAKEKHKGSGNPNYQNYWSEEQKNKQRGNKNPMFGKGFKGKENPMFGNTGQKHPRAKIYVLQDPNNIIYEVYDHKEFKKLFGISAYGLKISYNKRKNKRTTWKLIEILPRDTSKIQCFSIRN